MIPLRGTDSDGDFLDFSLDCIVAVCSSDNAVYVKTDIGVVQVRLDSILVHPEYFNEPGSKKGKEV